MPKELELIRGIETLVMPKASKELIDRIHSEYQYWFEYDSIRNHVTAMRLLGEAHTALLGYESLVAELEAEVGRLGRLAQY